MILIAVALFAALSYTVANMMREGSPDEISEKKAKLYANEILDYSRGVRQAVQNMRISNECSATQINFENTFVAGYINAGAPADDSCDVFNPSGGGMIYVVPPDDWADDAFSGETLYKQWYFTGHTCIEDVGGDETNCHTDTIDNSDLILYLPYIEGYICREINNALEIANPGGDAPIDSDSVWPAAENKFTGTYAETGRRNDVGNSQNIAGCFKSTGADPTNNSYTFYQVLIAR